MTESDETQSPTGDGNVAPDVDDTAPEAPQGAAEPLSPEEEEMRRRFEEELRKLRVEDVLLQSVVSLINLTSRRIAKPDEQDLEQARVGIEAIRALTDLLEAEPAAQVREALSQLQVAYAREAGGEAGGGAQGEGGPEGGPQQGGGDAGSEPSGPEDKPASGLWTPHDRG